MCPPFAYLVEKVYPQSLQEYLFIPSTFAFLFNSISLKEIFQLMSFSTFCEKPCIKGVELGIIFF